MFVFNTVVIAAHRRSGAQWAIDALRHNSPAISETYMSLEQIETGDHAAVPLADFRRQLLNLEGQVLISAQEMPTADHWAGLDERLFVRTILRNSPTIYVHRDGRDVMVSMYYYMKSLSETVRNQSFSRFLRAEPAQARPEAALSRPAYWARHVESWLAKDDLLAVAYRDLETDYAATLRRMADFINVRLNPELKPVDSLSKSDDANALMRFFERRGIGLPGRRSSDHPRVGKSGDWRHMFDKSDRAFFEREAGEALRRLGYAKVT